MVDGYTWRVPGRSWRVDTKNRPKGHNSRKQDLGVAAMCRVQKKLQNAVKHIPPLRSLRTPHPPIQVVVFHRMGPGWCGWEVQAIRSRAGSQQVLQRSSFKGPARMRLDMSMC